MTERFENVGTASRRLRGIALGVFLTFNFFYLLCSTGRVRVSDEYMTMFETESIVLRHSTSIPQSVQLGNFYGKYDRAGQPRAPYPPGQAIAAVPWYVVGRYVIGNLPGVRPSIIDFIVGFTCCLSNATFAAAAVAFFFLILASLGIAERAALLATAIFGLATPIFAYSAWFYSEPLTTLLWMAGTYLLFGRDLTQRSALIAGVVTGASVLVRPTNALVLCLFTISIVIWKGGGAMSKAVWFAIGAAIPIGVLFLNNLALFGNPLDFGYPTVAEDGRKLNSFSTPFYEGLYGLLFSPGKSLFLFAPPVLLAMLGHRKLWTLHRGLAFVAFGAPILYLLFFCTYAQWEGGYCYGPRYLVPSISLFCLALGAVLQRNDQLSRAVTGITFALGLLVQCIGIATSFLEAEVSSKAYYEASWRYNLNFSIAEYVRVFFHYLHHSGPAPLGLGFDRWFLFLSKAGISTGVIASIAVIMMIGLVGSCAYLRKAIR